MFGPLSNIKNNRNTIEDTRKESSQKKVAAHEKIDTKTINLAKSKYKTMNL